MATRAALLLFVVALCMSVGTRSAGAHANLERSEPEANAVLAQSPFEIKLYFSEEPDLGSSHVEVLDTSGNRLDNDDLHTHDAPTTLSVTVPALPDGTYTVAWRNVSTVDGHPRAGTFAFSVGEPSGGGDFDPDQFALDTGGPPRWLAAIVRWISYTSLFALLGIAAFPLLVLRPALRRASIDVNMEATERRKTLALATISLLIVGAILALLMQAWTSGGDASSVFGADLRHVLMDTRFGATWWARAGLTIVAGACMTFLLRSPPSGHRSILEWLLVAVAVLLPLTVSLNSHAAADDEFGNFGTGVDWLHLVAAGLWIGGLVQLTVAVAPSLRRLDVATQVRALSTIVPRFSTLAIICVAVVVFTGVNQWFLLIGNLDDTLHSEYGITLIIKVAVFLPLIALGAVNLLVLRPAIGRQVRNATDDERQVSNAFWRAVGAEVALGITVIAITGVLTTGSPPYSGSATAGNEGALIQTQETSQGVEVTLSVDPGTAGQNQLDFILVGLGDDEEVTAFVVRFTYLDDELGTTEDEATAIHPTHFQIVGSQLSLAGRWELEAIARGQEFADIIATFLVDVTPPPTPSGPEPTLEPLPTITGERVDITASNSQSFDQTAVSSRAGSLSIVFTNNETGVPHNVHVVAGDEANERDVAATDLERGPNRSVLKVQLPAGTYRYLCDIHPAMQGTLTLEQ